MMIFLPASIIVRRSDEALGMSHCGPDLRELLDGVSNLPVQIRRSVTTMIESKTGLSDPGPSAFDTRELVGEPGYRVGFSAAG